MRSFRFELYHITGFIEGVYKLAYLVFLEETTMEESEEAFWDRILQSFVNSNGNDQGRTTQCQSERFGDIRCKASILAYVASVGREFKFAEAYEIIKENVLGLY
ncbi:hypothetical protein MKW98_005965 [Papaver atlanticum]|uniref:Uncharacterized protein n=1 Tax=Papaver atlanticum TaxID=357466 RepID=A0AAD4S6Z5_9MAGN|nr:hypothetical protein MKW98_005965 [Papaver atlanticum]